MGARDGLELSVVILVLKWSRSIFRNGVWQPIKLIYTVYMEPENCPRKGNSFPNHPFSWVPVPSLFSRFYVHVV